MFYTIILLLLQILRKNLTMSLFLSLQPRNTFLHLHIYFFTSTWPTTVSSIPPTMFTAVSCPGVPCQLYHRQTTQWTMIRYREGSTENNRSVPCRVTAQYERKCNRYSPGGSRVILAPILMDCSRNKGLRYITDRLTHVAHRHVTLTCLHACTHQPAL